MHGRPFVFPYYVLMSSATRCQGIHPTPAMVDGIKTAVNTSSSELGSEDGLNPVHKLQQDLECTISEPTWQTWKHAHTKQQDAVRTLTS